MYSNDKLNLKSYFSVDSNNDMNKSTQPSPIDSHSSLPTTRMTLGQRTKIKTAPLISLKTPYLDQIEKVQDPNTPSNADKKSNSSIDQGLVCNSITSTNNSSTKYRKEKLNRQTMSNLLQQKEYFFNSLSRVSERHESNLSKISSFQEIK